MERIASCPRCEGDVFINWDCTDGEWYEYCLQCSHRHYLPVVAKTSQSSVSETKRKKRELRSLESWITRPRFQENETEPGEASYIDLYFITIKYILIIKYIIKYTI